MGSVPSTPNREGSNDPWWPIENQNLELNPFTMDSNEPNNLNNNQNVNAVDTEQQQQQLGEHRIETAAMTNTSDLSETKIDNDVKNVSKNTGEIETKSHSSVECDTAREKCDEKRQQSLEEFKEELRVKRELRKCAISELRNEIGSLRDQLAEQKAINQRLIDEKANGYGNSNNNNNSNIETIDDIDSATENIVPNYGLHTQLADVQLSLQNANTEILLLSNELTASKKQVQTLKEVILASKEMISIRETQLEQLKTKLKQIEDSLGEREMHLMSENLRQEYDRQLINIRNLRALYEERARVSVAEKENLNRQLETSRAEYRSEVEKNKNLEEHIASLEADLKSTSIDLYATREKFVYYKAESCGLHEEMTVINQLFSQLLAGFSGNNDIDIDKLTNMLEDNRDLLNDMTNRESSKEGAAQLPKLLFDLVSQSDNVDSPSEKLDNNDIPSTSTAEQTPNDKKLTSSQEIINNLPKVWKVLIELLNHQQLKPVQIMENSQSEDCYKSVETPSGPQMQLSVSKTYIKLKDLILEKKFLQKETKKLKNLNSHLECRMGEQEKRLSTVTIELNKTWNLVGRMQRQHRQLHTHEQVLRYQLQQKRRMLNELKEELEYCRRKWNLAKEKNNESQSQWETLRLEFSKRKETDANNSAESGYSDSPVSDDDDEEKEDETSIDESISRNNATKRKANKEKFLLNIDENERKVRIQSVSPVRTAKIDVSRCNSDSQITQLYATEVFQVQADIVEPIVHLDCVGCCEHCVIHTVHFDTKSTQLESDGEKVKITEPIVRNPNDKVTNAQKLIDAKASTSKVKIGCHCRKLVVETPQPSTSKDESLEVMFLRLSGQEQEDVEQENRSNELIEEEQSIETEPDIKPNNINNTTTHSKEATFLSTDDERRVLRAARIQRLEEQCQCLLKQVARASDRGDALNRQIDEVHKRYTPDRENRLSEQTEAQQQQQQQQQQPSTSGASTSKSTKSDEECLSDAERSYTNRRDERLKQLEADSQAFLNKIKSTNRKATVADNKLEFLHGRYGKENELKTVCNRRAAISTKENSAKVDLSSLQQKKHDNKIEKVTEATARSPIDKKTNAQKLIEAKASTSKVKIACHKSTAASPQPSPSNNEESLEAMFMRLSGQEYTVVEQDNQSNELIEKDEEEEVEEIEKLEEKEEEEVEKEKEKEEAESSESTSTLVDDAAPSTSQTVKTDEECLTDVERSYTSRRDERLKRLEAESQAFLNKIKSKNHKLEILHRRFHSETGSNAISNDESTNNDGNENSDSSPDTGDSANGQNNGSVNEESTNDNENNEKH